MPLLKPGEGATAPSGQPVAVPGSAKLTKEEKRGKAKARREAKYNAALTLQKVIESAKITLTADAKAALDLLTRQPRAGSGNFGEPLFNKIFGATPAVGMSVILQDVFMKTQKGADKMASLVRRWEQKGIATVEHVHNAAEPVKSTYTIRKIGA